MSGRLTDEQLRDWREDPFAYREMVLVIDELLALRAALEKTRGDVVGRDAGIRELEAAIERLKGDREYWMRDANEAIAELEKARGEMAQIDAALETWFYPGEFDSRVKAVQETARIWDGIVAALDIGDSDADVVKTIQDMVEYAGAAPSQSDIECGQMIAKRFFPVNHTEEYDDLTNQIAAALIAKIAPLREALGGLIAALDDMHFLGETVTARVSLWMSSGHRALKGKGGGERRRLNDETRSPKEDHV